MLSPNDLSAKGKAASIRSFDSGYGSNTLEDDEPLHLLPQPSSTTAQPSAQQPIGLGIRGLGFDGFRNVHIEDKLRLRRPGTPIDPVTTKLNVFTTKEVPIGALPLPTLAAGPATCITCQLWDLTNPGEGLKCDACNSKDYIRPELLHLFDTSPKLKLAVPRLDIPQDSELQKSSKQRNSARCSACDLARAIDSTKSAACTSCSPNPTYLSPISPLQPSTVKRSCARRANKLPPHALHHLRAWLRANRDDPYPSADTKRVLAQECGITEKQVTTWFTNTRARKLPLPNDSTRPSSEDEGAYESDFSSVTNTPIYTASPTFNYNTPSNNSYHSSFSKPAAHDHTQLTLQTSRRGKKKDYRRVNTVSPVDDSPVPRTPATPSPNPDSPEQQTWQCTFCYQHLVPKSWRRHEETQHRPKYQWTCLATGPRLVISSRTGTSSLCAFCQLKNPSDDHLLHSHRITECSKKSEADRTFGRPDHLRQHIKNFHKTSLLDLVRDKWRRDGPGKNVNEGWTCGFCSVELKTWDIRETHIANHFKDGLTMADWIDQPQSAASVTVNNRRRPSRDEHTAMLTKLKRTLTGRPNHHSEHYSSPQNYVSATLDPSISSSDCPNIAAAPVLPEFNGMDFSGYMPDGFINEFDFSGPSDAANLAALYPATGNSYAVYLGDEAMQMNYDTLANPELYGNFVDYQGVWNTEQQ